MDATELLISPVAHMPPAGVLDGLSGEQAAARVPGVSHSAVEILAHMVFWQSWFLERCRGFGTPPAASASLGWPAATAGDWEPLRGQFLAGLEQAREIGTGETSRLRRIDPPIEFPPLANYCLADAVTHIAIHNSHHLGQIITIRQILGAWPPPGGSFTW